MVVTRSRAQFWNKLMASPPKVVPYPVSDPKMEPSPVSDSFALPKSTEQKLAEALAEIEALKKKCNENDKELLDYMNEKTASISSLLSENKALKAENEKLMKENLRRLNRHNEDIDFYTAAIDSYKKELGAALDRSKQLRERIANPFKSATSRPRF